MAKIYNFLCFVIIVIFTTVTAIDYCNLKSCNQRGSHTMCRFRTSRPAAACGKYSFCLTSGAERNEIVNKHNQLRQGVASGRETRGNPGPQPASVSIPNLVWDNELAQIAQRWANQCNFSHDKCRNVDRYVVGQNIAITFNSRENKSTMSEMIQMWYDEVKDFNKTGVSSYKFDPRTGHYTQVVWARSRTIGCGCIKYKENGLNKKYLVCNYGPSGNYQGQPVYRKK